MPRVANTQVSKINLEQLEIREPINKIEVFKSFCLKDINSAIEELRSITTENNRTHLQKLVYVNLVNQFDYLLDNLLLWLSINSEKFRVKVLKDLDKETISKKEVFELFFLKDESYELVVGKIQDETRSKILRGRHSKKLDELLKILNFEALEKPRVNNSNGKIYNTRKKHQKIPNTIVGYADWLYSRRNSMVHGANNQFNSMDYDHITRTYGVKMAKNFHLTLPSINTAVTFYIDLLSDIFSKITAKEYLKHSK